MKWLAVAIALLPAVAHAQEAPALRRYHVVLDAGMHWSGGYDIGDSTALLRGNGTGATPPGFTFFNADSRMTHVYAGQVRVEFALTRHVAIEAGGMRAGPRIGVHISGDPEAPAQQLLGEELRQFVIDGGVTWQLPFSMRRAAPFVAAGAGYLRQLHEDRTLGETGQIYYAGGGARYWLRGGDRAAKALGLRGDLRVNFRRGGIDFENTMRAYPTLSLSAFIGF